MVDFNREKYNRETEPESAGERGRKRGRVGGKTKR
jgi:hypothetical protein